MPKQQESDYSQEFLKILKVVPGFTAFKHCDRFTTGVPDISVSNSFYNTMWVEVKRIHKDTENIRKPKDFIGPRNVLQLHNGVKLGAHYLVIDVLHNEHLWIPAHYLRLAYNASKYVDESFVIKGDRNTAYLEALNTIKFALLKQF